MENDLSFNTFNTMEVKISINSSIVRYRLTVTKVFAELKDMDGRLLSINAKNKNKREVNKADSEKISFEQICIAYSQLPLFSTICKF